MKNLDEMSTEELLLEAQSKNLDNMFSRLNRKPQPELPNWVAAVDEKGLSRGYEESYENWKQRL